MNKLKQSKAFSLVEIIVALFITSLVSIAIVSLYNSGAKNFSQVDETSKLQNESNLLFAMIERDLARGGFTHPLRGDVTNTINCKSIISATHAINIVSGTEISSCFDKPSFDETAVYRYKITYKKGTFSGGPDANTLYKKVERTDDCATILSSSTDPNFASTVHGWQPVSDNINSITFSYPTIGTDSKTDILDVDIKFQSRRVSDYQLDFRKRVFLRNKSLTSNSSLCDNRCPNSKKLFADYNISDDNSAWNPSSQNVPGAKIAIQTGHVQTEDKLKWDTSLASTYNMTVSYDDATGVLSIDGIRNGSEYENFLKSITYVNTITTPSSRTTIDGSADREIIMSLGYGGSVCDPIGRKVSTVRHFYCYATDTTTGHGGWPQGGPTITGNQLWWGEAKLQAEATKYYNLKGYLTTITSSAENTYILGKIRKSDGTTYAAGWTGGNDETTENTWVWAGGPEMGTAFYSHDGNSGNDGYTNWRTGEPNDCCDDLWFTNATSQGSSVGYNGDLATDTGEHFPTRGGEHYLQYTETGGWNDLFVTGVNYNPFLTDGYILEFSTNFTTTDTCNSNTGDNQLACVIYFAEKELVLDDTTYQDQRMLDFCDPNP